MSKIARIVSLVSVTDGNVYDFADDGVEDMPGSFGEKRPKQKRSILLGALKKTLKDGTPVYFAGTRKTAADGSFSFSPSKVEQLFAGDPVAQMAKPLTKEAITIIEGNLKRRSEIHRASVVAQGAELASFMEKMARAAGAAGASAKASAQEGKADG